MPESKMKLEKINRQYDKKVWLQVHKRDQGKCQNPACFYRGDETNQHHIKDWKRNKELRFEPDNLVTLCSTRRVLFFFRKQGCHQKLHAWNGGTHKPCDEKTLLGFYRYSVAEANNYSTSSIVFFVLFVIASVAIVSVFVLN